MMKQNIIRFLMAALLGGAGAASAQTLNVSGRVLDANSDPVAGATVLVKGTTNGVTTDINGSYDIAADPDATLTFSFLGLGSKDEIIGGRARIDVQLSASEQAIDEVVVTAMGITRSQKALGYAVQTVTADNLVQAGNPNLGSALAGKTTGLSVRPSSGMPGASVQINIRGARAFDGNNTPLYVVDGVPIASTASVSTGNSVSGTDFANRAVDIDPNDIESINILEGQASAALYGLRASNGVIVITTKSGKKLAKGKPQVTLSSSVSVDAISRYPELQTKYAQGSRGAYNPTSSMSWGPLIEELPNSAGYGGNTINQYTDRDGAHPGQYYVPQRANAGLDPWTTPAVYNNVEEYFDKGITWNNYVNVAQALEQSSYSFSLGSTNQTGIIPSTGMDRYNAKLNAETQLSKKWRSGFVANFVNTSMSKMPSANDGVVATIYPAPPSYNLKGIPAHYDNDPARPNNYRSGSWAPAYWAPDNIHFKEKTDRFYGSAFLDYTTQLGDAQKLTAKYQAGIDAYTTSYEDMWGYGIKGTANNGQIENYSFANRNFNSLLTLTYSWKINDKMNLDVIAGNEIDHSAEEYLYAYGGGFEYAGWNHINNATTKDNEERFVRKRTVGFFGQVSWSFADMLYVSATGRNDFISHMPTANRSFFYPSVSLGFIFTEIDALKGNSILNFGKLRASFAEVGQAGDYRSSYYYTPGYGSGFYLFTPFQYPVNGQNAYVPYYVAFDPNLRPQNTKSYEAGIDLGFLNNLVTFKYTFSRQNVTDQIFQVPLSASTGTLELLTNAGALHTNAHEISLGFNPVRTTNINWEVGFNWSKIDNYVDELAEGVESIMLGGFVTPQVRASAGDKYPVIYGTTFKRKDGKIVVDETGTPVSGGPGVIGKVSPDFTLGISTTLTIYKATLSAVFEWKQGGQMYSGTNGLLHLYGVSKETEGRDGSFVFDGVKEDGTPNDIAISGATDWEQFYSNFNGIDESSIYKNSFFKLREVSLSYPVLRLQWLQVSLNVFARNLLLWSEYPNFDPEASQGNTNMTGAFERFSLPQTSSFGGGITLKF